MNIFKVHYVPGKQSIISILMLVSIGVACAGGCCHVLPFVDCEVKESIFVSWIADRVCNDSLSLRAKVLMLSEVRAFDENPAHVIFRPENHRSSYEAIGILGSYDFFVTPGRSGEFEWRIDLPDTCNPANLHLAIIANYAKPASTAAIRHTRPMSNLRLPIRIEIEFLKNSLTASIRDASH